MSYTNGYVNKVTWIFFFFVKFVFFNIFISLFKIFFPNNPLKIPVSLLQWLKNKPSIEATRFRVELWTSDSHKSYQTTRTSKVTALIITKIYIY